MAGLRILVETRNYGVFKSIGFKVSDWPDLFLWCFIVGWTGGSISFQRRLFPFIHLIKFNILCYLTACDANPEVKKRINLYEILLRQIKKVLIRIRIQFFSLTLNRIHLRIKNLLNFEVKYRYFFRSKLRLDNLSIFTFLSNKPFCQLSFQGYLTSQASFPAP